jgi:predicted ABC-type transport system involved in lysophospholipase L1 biosynthesis ATPase subunit
MCFAGYQDCRSAGPSCETLRHVVGMDDRLNHLRSQLSRSEQQKVIGERWRKLWIGVALSPDYV